MREYPETMKAFCYIIFSEKLNRYYIGSTELQVTERLKMHNEHHYGRKKFTAAASDWMIYLEIECDSILKARNIESFIKRMKTRRFIESLKNPKRVDWLLENC